MKSFEYHAPTALYVGEKCLENNEKVIISFGQRAFIITGRFSGNCRNLALEDVCDLLGRSFVEYEVYSEVEENPSVESIVRAAKRIRGYKPQYIIAIGGGSALDTAKAANVLLKYPDHKDAYEVFYGGEQCLNSCDCGVLPMLSVPTTAGSGSDVMGFAILTRTDTDTKLRMNQLSYFEASFLDARYVIESPAWLLDAGAMDALAHGIEGVLNTHNTPTSAVWHEFGFSLFSQFKDALLRRELSHEDCERMLLAASVQGMGNMQSCTTIPHGMGYPLTHFKAVTHGIASIMTVPAFFKTFKNQTPVEQLLKKCGFSAIDEFEQYIKTIVNRNIRISVTKDEINAWAKECYSLKNRLEAHIEPIREDTIRDVYLEALKDFMV